MLNENLNQMVQKSNGRSPGITNAEEKNNEVKEKKTMQNPLITRWELTPEKKFKSFMQDLVNYLKCTLIPFEAPDGTISYGCTKYAYDESYMRPFERVANFCIERNLNPYEVIDMVNEFMGGEDSCECGWLEDEKIANLIEEK